MNESIKKLKKILEYNVETLKYLSEAKDEYQWSRDMLYAIETNNLKSLISFDNWKKMGELGALLGTDVPINPAYPEKGTIMEHNGEKLSPFQKQIKDIVTDVVRRVKSGEIKYDDMEKEVCLAMKRILRPRKDLW